MTEVNEQQTPPAAECRDYRFFIGLLTGACVGAGVLWLVPRFAADVQRVTDSAKNAGRRASAQYRQASDCVGLTVEDISRKAQVVRNDVADAVARGARVVERGAQQAERFATAARGDRPAEGAASAAADRSASVTPRV